MTKAKSSKRDEILGAFRKVVQKESRPATLSELFARGFTWSMVKHYFGSHAGLLSSFKKEFPKDAELLKEDASLFSAKRHRALRDEIANKKVFIVSTAVSDCEADENFLGSTRTFERVRDASLLLMPAGDHKNVKGSFNLDDVLKDEHVVFRNTRLNSNFHLSSIKLNAKDKDPTAGLNRFGNKAGSFLHASPKQRMRTVPVEKGSIPRVVMTTGAITKPGYASRTFYNSRNATIAEMDHVMGGTVVEIVDDRRYFFRQVQADKDGSFIDLGVKYTPEGTEKAACTALVLGDWHHGETDPDAIRCTREMAQLLRPKYLVVHDLFNGTSISHYERGKHITQAIKSEQGELDLERELIGTANDLNEMASWGDSKIVVVKSNHDEWLKRYIEDAAYLDEPHNRRAALKIASAMMDGHDPLTWGCENIGRIADRSRIIWLDSDANFRQAGVQLGYHGHNGNNGARGSLAGHELALVNSITAHSHRPEILRGAFCVGTLTRLILPYKTGASSWMQANCALYQNGARQLMFIVDGAWRA